jgi:hypothetical protein
MKVLVPPQQPGQPDPIDELVKALRADARVPADPKAPKTAKPPAVLYDNITYDTGSESDEVRGGREYTIRMDVLQRPTSGYSRAAPAEYEPPSRKDYPPKEEKAGKQ